MPLRTVLLPGMILITTAMVSACTGATGTLSDIANRGQTEKTNFDQHQTLLAEQDGWRLYETGYHGRTACLAIKPATGQDWPIIRQGRTLNGGTGFALYLLDGLDVPFLGFYGPHGFGRDQAELAGQTFRYVDNRDQALRWEGQTVQFSITAQPTTPEDLSTPLWERDTALVTLSDQKTPVRAVTDDLNQGGVTSTGSVDFTGITALYDLLLRCHMR